MYYTMTGKARLEDLSKAECREMDKEQGRQRLSNAALESMIAVLSARVILRTHLDRLKPLLDNTGTGKMLPAYMGGLSRELDKVLDTVSIEQLRTILANTRDTSIIVSSNWVEPYVNVRGSVLHGLASQAMEVCSMMCAKTAHESKDCPVRKALEQVPGMSVIKAGGGGMCPYAGMSLEVETE